MKILSLIAIDKSAHPEGDSNGVPMTDRYPAERLLISVELGDVMVKRNLDRDLVISQLHVTRL
jgi:hypothetical protein